MVLVASLADHEDLAVRAAWMKVERARSRAVGYPLALVRALNELGALLLDRHEHEHGLAVATAVLELSQNPEIETVAGARIELLLALNFRVTAFAGLGRDHEALHAAKDVVEILSECRAGPLGAQHRDALSRLIMLQGAQELHDEALATADRLIDLGRERYAADPDANAADLALGLHNRYAALVKLGRLAEAADTLGALVALFEQVGDDRQLVGSLSDLGYLRLELGEPGRAIELLRAAVELGRRVAAEDPTMNDRLCMAMANLAQAEESVPGLDRVPLLSELVDLLRRLDEAGPVTDRSRLAKVLNNLAMALMRAGSARGGPDGQHPGGRAVQDRGRGGPRRRGTARPAPVDLRRGAPGRSRGTARGAGGDRGVGRVV